MKRCLAVLALLVLVTVMGVGCGGGGGGGGGGHDPSVMGTWLLDGEPGISSVFSSNGTYAVYDGNETVETGTWETDGNTISTTDGSGTDTARYSVSGNTWSVSDAEGHSSTWTKA